MKPFVSSLFNVFFGFPKSHLNSFHLENEVNDFIIVNSETFLKMYKKDPESVIDAEIIAPKLGSKEFGYFKIPSKTNLNQFELLDE